MLNQLRIFHFFKFLTIASCVLLLASQIYHSFNFPIWRDDAGFAQLAKSLINGDNYSAVLFEENHPFFSSLGPVAILPVVPLMLVFGNQYWVPGVSNIILIWAIILMIFFLSDKFIGKEKKWMFCFLSLSLTVLFSVHGGYSVGTGDMLILWHLLMGEIPASLLVILSIFLIFSSPQNVKKILIGSFVLGCAIMVKTITAMAAAVIGLTLALQIFISKSQKNYLIIAAFCCMIFPSLLLELAKVLFMKWPQYLELQHINAEAYKYNAFIASTRESNGITISPNLRIHFYELLNFFGFAIFFLIPASAYIAYLSYKNKNNSHCLLGGIILLLCFVVHLLWWIFYAVPGADRHLVAALVYYLCGISLLIANIDYKKQSRGAIGIIFFFLFLLFSAREDAIKYLMFDSFKQGNEKLEEQLLVVNTIKDLEEQGVSMISCGDNFELEYLLPKNGHFKRCRDILEKSFSKPVMLVNYFVSPKLVLAIEYDQYYGSLQTVPQEIYNRCNQRYLVTKNYSLLWCK